MPSTQGFAGLWLGHILCQLGAPPLTNSAWIAGSAVLGTALAGLSGVDAFLIAFSSIAGAGITAFLLNLDSAHTEQTSFMLPGD